MAAPGGGRSGSLRARLRVARDRLRARYTRGFFVVISTLAAVAALVVARLAALPAWVAAVAAVIGPLLAWAGGLLVMLRRVDAPRLPDSP